MSVLGGRVPSLVKLCRVRFLLACFIASHETTSDICGEACPHLAALVVSAEPVSGLVLAVRVVRGAAILSASHSRLSCRSISQRPLSTLATTHRIDGMHSTRSVLRVTAYRRPNGLTVLQGEIIAVSMACPAPQPLSLR